MPNSHCKCYFCLWGLRVVSYVPRVPLSMQMVPLPLGLRKGNPLGDVHTTCREKMESTEIECPCGWLKQNVCLGRGGEGMAWRAFKRHVIEQHILQGQKEGSGRGVCVTYTHTARFFLNRKLDVVSISHLKEACFYMKRLSVKSDLGKLKSR